MKMLAWGKKHFKIPKLTWALKVRNKPLVYCLAYIYQAKEIEKKIIKKFIKKLLNLLDFNI